MGGKVACLNETERLFIDSCSLILCKKVDIRVK